jgi:DNA-binding CsgD family transcriptional regulator
VIVSQNAAGLAAGVVDDQIMQMVGGGRGGAPFVERRSFVRPLSIRSSPRFSEAEAWFENDETARFVLDMSGRVLTSNAAARALAACGMLGSGGVFICSSHRNRAELDLLLTRLSEGREKTGRILFRAGDDAWCILDLITAIETPGRVFATVRPVKPLDEEKLAAVGCVFGLTRMEKSVLLLLASGEAPKEISRRLDMSIHTVRSHLRSICMRMGVKGINGALRLSFMMT